MLREHLHLAERVIRTAERTRPADAVLRQELKSHRDLTPGDAGQISRTVFAYYRWRGWLDEQKPLQDQLRSACELAERFAHAVKSFTDAELVARAVPGWVKQEMAVTGDWVRSLQAEPKLWLRSRAGQGSALGKGLGDCRVFGEGLLADTLEYQGRKDLFVTAEFHAGQFEIQDLNSQAVGFICAPLPGQLWWDACAGEGGKTLHLSALMQNKGLIWASDRAGWRLRRLKRRAARAGVFNYRTVEWDGGPKLPTRTKFDGVLVDAPCSGVGTWQRNPHARWTTTPRDVRDLGMAQQQLLRATAAAVKPGGKLLYAVCSLTTSETEAVAAAFSQAFPAFQPLPITNPFVPNSPAASVVCLWPQQFGGNGMFVAGWIRAG
jgi:16S rRNA (cytosine967-C5)-methyltransferase